MLTRNFAHICNSSKDLVVDKLGICSTWPCSILELIGLLLYDFLKLFDLVSFSLSELSSLVDVVWVSGKRILFNLEFLNKLMMDPQGVFLVFICTLLCRLFKIHDRYTDFVIFLLLLRLLSRFLNLRLGLSGCLLLGQLLLLFVFTSHNYFEFLLY